MESMNTVHHKKYTQQAEPEAATETLYWAAVFLHSHLYRSLSAVKQCNNFTQDPEHNYLLSTFDSRIGEMSGKLSSEQAEAYKVQNRQLVLEQLSAHFQYNQS